VVLCTSLRAHHDEHRGAGKAAEGGQVRQRLHRGGRGRQRAYGRGRAGGGTRGKDGQRGFRAHTGGSERQPPRSKRVQQLPWASKQSKLERAATQYW
jgi:hypothetical protein